jgi:(E)-4-hydroxy-3-methylbut-2-enyl-diphosphate synthase
MNTNNTYCNDILAYSRFKTREVTIGSLKLGGNNPIRVQSMTTTDTLDTEKTVEQSIRMIEAGCELVRITAPSIKEAENLLNIKNELRKRGYQTPLVADIHFTPNAAEVAARIVEKVRVNPGNYADKKKFEFIEYTDSAYEAELERIRNRFIPLVNICKENGTAMRIGTNHGSLSDRILSRYGDTPLGMVESAMEFLRICEELNYKNIVLSMKASNPQVMVQAYRLLVNQMISTGMNYPLHLGVTEAGDGEDGRIKSALGIGALLEDGLGDTVRVSLTEEPEFEIPIAKALVERYNEIRKTKYSIPLSKESIQLHFNPFQYEKRETDVILNFGTGQVPRVIADLSLKSNIQAANLFAWGYQYSIPNDKWNIHDMACDYVYIGNNNIDFEIPGTLGIIQNAASCNYEKDRHYPLFEVESYLNASNKSSKINFVLLNCEEYYHYIHKLHSDKSPKVLLLKATGNHQMSEMRAVFIHLKSINCKIPVVIQLSTNHLSIEQFSLYTSTDAGALLIDGFGDGIFVSINNNSSSISAQHINQTCFGILQASRTRISKTEYISCPSCGRTLFDLQETTAKIRAVTHHLKGVKIGIMGCIVNGPGEMADADYGYVGTGVDKITLYKGKEVVKRNIDSSIAVQELIDLIKTHGDWVEPQVLN